MNLDKCLGLSGKFLYGETSASNGRVIPKTDQAWVSVSKLFDSIGGKLYYIYFMACVFYLKINSVWRRTLHTS